MMKTRRRGVENDRIVRDRNAYHRGALETVIHIITVELKHTHAPTHILIHTHTYSHILTLTHTDTRTHIPATSMSAMQT